MRTNVDIDFAKIEKIKELDTRLRSKKKIIDLALDNLIGSLHREKLRQMRGKVEWDGDLDKMRSYDVPLI